MDSRALKGREVGLLTILAKLGLKCKIKQKIAKGLLLTILSFEHLYSTGKAF